MSDLAVSGVSRCANDDREIVVYFSEPLSADDVRTVHDMLRENLAGRDPYRGARDDMEIWKRRALEAEGNLQRLCDQINAENGPTRMGEPIVRQAESRQGEVLAAIVQDTFYDDDTETWSASVSLPNGRVQMFTPLYTAPPAQAMPVVPEGWRPVPIRSLEKLMMYCDPEPMRLPSGETMVFKNPNAAETLTRISAEIRAMLAAPSPQERESDER